MIAIVFCIFLLVLFAVVAFIGWPGGSAVNISKEGKNSISELKDEWFMLDADSYEVLNEFGEFVTQHSTFFYPITYYYFNVLVTDAQGQQFIMGVRTGKKTEELRSGRAVKLYGMAVPLDEERMISQSQSLSTDSSDAEVYSICLNDNDETILGRYVQSIFFIILAVIDLFVIFFILLKR